MCTKIISSFVVVLVSLTLQSYADSGQPTASVHSLPSGFIDPIIQKCGHKDLKRKVESILSTITEEYNNADDIKKAKIRAVFGNSEKPVTIRCLKVADDEVNNSTYDSKKNKLTLRYHKNIEWLGLIPFKDDDGFNPFAFHPKMWETNCYSNCPTDFDNFDNNQQ